MLLRICDVLPKDAAHSVSQAFFVIPEGNLRWPMQPQTDLETSLRLRVRWVA
jgi:hypothetical protein